MARAHRSTIEANRARRWEAFHADPDKWFWTKVDRRGPDECWPWQGYIAPNRRGYGRVKHKRRLLSAHRMALILARGEPSDPSMVACHSCDNPPCCNPNHLWWGSNADNMADAKEKGRMRGHPRKIDRERLAARRRDGLSYSQLAQEFGVCVSSVGRALGGLGMAGPVRPNQSRKSIAQ